MTWVGRNKGVRIDWAGQALHAEERCGPRQARRGRVLTTPLVDAAQLYLSNEKGGRRRGKPVGEFLDVRLVGRRDPYASFGIDGSRVT